MPTPTLSPEARSIRRAGLGWGIFVFVLLGASWRLWIGTGLFPRIPALRLCADLPTEWCHNCDMLAVLVLAISGGTVLLTSFAFERNYGRKTALVFFAISLLTLFMTNQHRLQPWAYLLWVYAVVLATCRDLWAARLLRLVLVSVYVHSAISKLDDTFLHTIGQQFLATMCQILSIDSENWSLNTRLILAAGFPVAELLLGVGLIFSRTRRMAVWAAVTMHLVLVTLLGPWGLNHKPCVLLWNLFFIWQTWTLFTPEPQRKAAAKASPAAAAADSRANLAEKFAIVFVGIVALLPCLEPFGVWDHWLSWGLYAPRNSRAVIFIRQSQMQSLPAALHEFATPLRIEDPDFADDFVRLRIDLWSLEELGVPVYPQDRFQVGVGLGVAHRLPAEDGMVVVVQSAANRWHGERTEQLLYGREEIEQHARRYWLNALPRDELSPRR